MPNNSTDTVKVKSLRFGFDAKNKQAEKWAAKYAAKRVTVINTETEIAIRNFIRDMIRDQIPPREAAKQIKNMVGLNRPQAAALKKYVRGLNPALSPAAKAKAGIKLKKKMIRRRGSTIARTETIDALAAGAQQSWFQAQKKGVLGGDAKKEWMTTPFGACGFCQRMDGQQVLLNEKFDTNVKSIGKIDGPTTHPNCRCGVAPVPGMGGMTLTPPPVAATGAPISTMARMAVNADGELLKGSDARKAILKYADEEGEKIAAKLTLVRQKAAIAQGEAMQRSHEIQGRLIELRNKYTFYEPKRVFRLPEAQKKEMVALLKEQNQLKKKIKKLGAKQTETLEGVAEDILEKFIYNESDISSVELVIGRTMNAAQKKQWKLGSTAWQKLGDASFYTTELAGTVDEIKAVPVKVKRIIKVVKDRPNGNGRAWAAYDKDNAGEYIFFQGNGRVGRDASATIVHELSHTLEFATPELMAEALRFRNIVTKGDKLKSLREIMKSNRYRADEFAYDSENLGAYASKVYNSVGSFGGDRVVQNNIRYSSFDLEDSSRVWSDRDGWNIGTEVVTMGIQKMYTDPLAFAKESPEFFDFIYERVIKRKYTNTTSKWALRLNKDIKFVKDPTLKSTDTFGISGPPSDFLDKAIRAKQKQAEAIREIRLVKDY